VRWAVVGLLALTLTGCETTQEQAAKLEKVAKLHEREASKRGGLGARGLVIARASTRVRVLATSVLRSSEGAAAVVVLHNDSATAMRNVPVAITLTSATGATLYSNSAPGLSPALVSAPLVPAHGAMSWIDDQIPTGGAPAHVRAKVGEGEAFAGAIPRLSVQGAHIFEDPTNGPGAEGVLVNRSRVSQQEVVVYAVVRHAGTIVAAGRAILPQAPASASTRFQVFFIGDPRGGRLEVSAPPSSLG